LRGPALHLWAQRQHRPDDLRAAVGSLQIVVDVTDVTDPNLPMRRQRLAEVQRLHTDGRRTPAGRG
jgi:hypothetical protein